jgi:hypothetical protein
MPEEQKKDVDHGQTLASWTFPEFSAHQRGKIWYSSIIIICAAVLIWSAFTANYLFSLIVIIFGLILVLQNRQKAAVLPCQIKEDGLEVGRNFYNFKDIKKFYIIYQPPEVKTLYFDFKSTLRPTLPIPLENQNPLKVREILKKYLEEDLEKEEEPASDAVSRSLKI